MKCIRNGKKECLGQSCGFFLSCYKKLKHSHKTKTLKEFESMVYENDSKRKFS